MAAGPSAGLHVQIAELVIDPAQRGAFIAALRDQIEAALRDEPGVLTLHAVARTSAPERISVFEIYRDHAAYLAHLEAPHFLRYKAAVAGIVLDLTLIPVTPLALGAKPQGVMTGGG